MASGDASVGQTQNPELSMDADTLYIRLARERGWISQDVHDQALERVRTLKRRGFAKTAEDVLREGQFLDEEHLRVLRRILSRFTGQARIGDYTINRRIGIGGTGIVFEASHRRLDRTVALKVLFPRFEKAPGVPERFLKEAKILARVDHPNVVHAFDAGKDGDFCYIAMELVDGTDLAHYLDQQRTDRGGGAGEQALSVEQTLEFMLPVARALDAIHTVGLLHRDVKPANILISSDGVKLVDLGLFFGDVDRRVLWDGMVVGTPQYMSPEQIRGDPKIDARSDLYSFGITWYYALTGRFPFDVDSPMEVVHAHLEGTPIPPKQRRPDLPAWLDDVVIGLLSKDPDGRPRSAGELIAVLESIGQVGGVGDRPALPARPDHGRREAPGSARRVGGRRRRTTPTFLGVGGLLVAVVLGLTIGLTIFQKLPGEKEPHLAGVPELPATADYPAAVDDLNADVVGENAKRSGSPLVGTNRNVVRFADAIKIVGDVKAEAQKIGQHTIRVLRSAVGRTRSWATLFSGEPPSSSLPSSSLPTSPLPTSPLPTSPLPPAVSHWVRAAARDTEQSFSDRLLARGRGDQPVRVFLVTGETTVLVKAAPGGFRLVDASSPERTISRSSVHPLAVLSWGALSRSRVDLGVGYALSIGRNGWARSLSGRLNADLPVDVKGFVDRLPESPKRGEADIQDRFEWLLSLLERDLQAQRAQDEARWDIAGRVLDSLSDEISLPSALAGHREPWRSRARRADEFHWLTAVCFNGDVQIQNPDVEGFNLAIGYAFESASELGDFRFRVGRWELRKGRLVSTGRGLGQGIDTVAIFGLPVVVEGEWGSNGGERRGRLAIYFEGTAVGLGGPQGELTVFKTGSDEEKAYRRGGATGSGGTFRVEFDETRIRGSFSDVRVDTAVDERLLKFGRVAIRMEPRFQLERLSITGPLDGRWVRARMRAMYSEPANDKSSTH